MYLLECVCVAHKQYDDAPCCRWRGFFDNKKKWKIKLKTCKTKPGSSATQHNYYFANVGALKKCFMGVLMH